MRFRLRDPYFPLYIASIPLLLLTVSFVAYGYKLPPIPSEPSEGEGIQEVAHHKMELSASQMKASLGPPIAFATLAVVANSEDSESSSSSNNYYTTNTNDLEDIWAAHSSDVHVKEPDSFIVPHSYIQIEERVEKVTSKNSMSLVEMTDSSRYIMNISGEAGNIINIVAQLLEHRYDKSISIDNCRGYYINVEIRQVTEHGDSVVNSSQNAWSLFWNAIATMLDNSAFCELLPTVMLRVEPSIVDQSYYFIINARRGYIATANNFTCKMRVYVDQNSAETVWWQQNAFALILPLLLLIFTTPITLWHIHIIPSYIVDIDILSWMWYPPYVLRDMLLSMMISIYALIWGYYAERREQQRQRELEAQHRRIMQEAAATRTLSTQQTIPPPFQQQQQQQLSLSLSHQQQGEREREEGGRRGSVSSMHGGRSDGYHHGEEKEEEQQQQHEKHKPTVVHIPSPTVGAARTPGTHISNKKKHHNEEKQKLLGKQA
ncbi:uncharacterized protein TM35_000262140, partial [Trypanosoma theileri]